MNFQNNVFQNLRFLRVSTDGMGKNVMFKHDVFLPFHRLKPEKYEDFEKHYFGKIRWKTFDKTCSYWPIHPKHVPILNGSAYIHMVSQIIITPFFQNNVFQNLCIPAVSTDGMTKKHHVWTSCFFTIPSVETRRIRTFLKTLFWKIWW